MYYVQPHIRISIRNQYQKTVLTNYINNVLFQYFSEVLTKILRLNLTMHKLLEIPECNIDVTCQKVRFQKRITS